MTEGLNADGSRTAGPAFWVGDDALVPAAVTGPGNDTSTEGETEPENALDGLLRRLGPLPMPSEAERKRRCQGLLKLIAEYEAEMGAFTEEELAEAARDLRSIL